jgi:hypothetical protein
VSAVIAAAGALAVPATSAAGPPILPCPACRLPFGTPITVTTPANGASYVQNSVVDANWSCGSFTFPEDHCAVWVQLPTTSGVPFQDLYVFLQNGKPIPTEYLGTYVGQADGYNVFGELDIVRFYYTVVTNTAPY